MQDTIDTDTDLAADELAEWVEFNEQAAEQAARRAKEAKQVAADVAADLAGLVARNHPARTAADEYAKWTAAVAAKWAGRLEEAKRAASVAKGGI